MLAGWLVSRIYRENRDNRERSERSFSTGVCPFGARGNVVARKRRRPDSGAVEGGAAVRQADVVGDLVQRMCGSTYLENSRSDRLMLGRGGRTV